VAATANARRVRLGAIAPADQRLRLRRPVHADVEAVSSMQRASLPETYELFLGRAAIEEFIAAPRETTATAVRRARRATLDLLSLKERRATPARPARKGIRARPVRPVSPVSPFSPCGPIGPAGPCGPGSLSCNSGDIATDGGADTTNTTIYLSSSDPVGDPPTGWHAFATSTLAPGTLSIYVLCNHPSS
jgi:hypothetical protein